MMALSNFKMNSKDFGTMFVFLFMMFCISAQDCTLDIGGKNRKTIVDIFQLNAQQKTTMETLRAELEIETKSIEDEIKELFNEHPQSTPEELLVLADKYKVLQQKMVNTSKESDKKLLAVFNERQYQRYLELCHEAFRKPIMVVPETPKDSISSE